MDAPERNAQAPPGDQANPGADADSAAIAAIVARSDERQQREAEEAALREATKKRTSLLARGSALVLLSSALLGVVAVNIYLLRHPTAPPTAAEVESMARMETALVALTVEAFALNAGRYPQSLDEAGIDLTGVDYTPTSGGFVVSATAAPTTVILRADQDPQELVRDMPGGPR